MITKTVEATVITGDSIQLFRFLAAKHAVALQAKTGLKMRGNMAMRAAQAILTSNGVKPKRTAAAIVTQMETLQAKLYPIPTDVTPGTAQPTA